MRNLSIDRFWQISRRVCNWRVLVSFTNGEHHLTVNYKRTAPHSLVFQCHDVTVGWGWSTASGYPIIVSFPYRQSYTSLLLLPWLFPSCDVAVVAVDFLAVYRLDCTESHGVHGSFTDIFPPGLWSSCLTSSWYICHHFTTCSSS